MNNSYLITLLIFGVVSCNPIKITKKIDNKTYWDGNYVIGEMIGHSYYYEFENLNYKFMVRQNYSGEVSEQIIEQGRFTIKKNTMKLNPKVKLVTSLGLSGERELIVPYIIGESENSFYISKDTLNIKYIKEYKFEERYINIKSNNKCLQLIDSRRVFSEFCDVK